jgi:ribokinase
MIRGNNLTIGFSTVELQLSVPERAQNNSKRLESEKYRFTACGKGANAAIAISRLGWSSMLCTAIGDDMFGKTFVRIFTDEKVDLRYVKTSRNAQTSINVAFENGAGSEIFVPSAGGTISPTDVETAFNVMPDAVITSLEIPFDCVLKASQCTNVQNTMFILDTTGVTPDMDLSLLKRVDIAVLDDEDLAAITGVQIKSIDDRMHGCIKLNSKLNIGYTVIDMKQKGYYIYDGKYCSYVMPADIPVVNTKGSREAFIAYLAVSMLRTADIKDSVDFASIAASIASSREGGFESFPTEREIRNFAQG